MKKILFILGIMTCLNASGQFSDTTKFKDNGVIRRNYFSPGDELRLSARNSFIGYGFTAVGVFLVTSELHMKVQHQYTRIFGFSSMAVGMFFFVNSKFHTKRAGILLNENGVGVKLGI